MPRKYDKIAACRIYWRDIQFPSSEHARRAARTCTVTQGGAEFRSRASTTARALNYKSRGIYRKLTRVFEGKHVEEECEAYEIVVKLLNENAERLRSNVRESNVIRRLSETRI